jgi:hypothetical protein
MLTDLILYRSARGYGAPDAVRIADLTCRVKAWWRSLRR